MKAAAQRSRLLESKDTGQKDNEWVINSPVVPVNSQLARVPRVSASSVSRSVMSDSL